MEDGETLQRQLVAAQHSLAVTQQHLAEQCDLVSRMGTRVAEEQRGRKRVAEEQELLVLTALLSLEGVSSLLPSEPGSE